jgi:hypothetical protein
VLFVEATKETGEMIMPGAHEVAGQLDAVACPESPFLTVEGLVVAELLGEQDCAE